MLLSPFFFFPTYLFPLAKLDQPLHSPNILLIPRTTAFAMAEVARLIGMLQASQAQLPGHPSSDYGKPLNTGLSELSLIPELPKQERRTSQASSTSTCSIPSSLVEAFELVAQGGPLPPNPGEPQSEHFKVSLDRVLSTLNAIYPVGADCPTPLPQVKETTQDLVNDLAIANSTRIFAAAQDPFELQAIAHDLKVDTMAGRLPVLSTSNLPPATAQEQSATASPARGSAMLNSIFKSVRVPEFRFKWQFWAEKGQQSTTKDKPSASEDFASRPKPLGEQIISIKEFYQHFNNIPTDSLKLRDSIHLFHLGVKPLWEDPRNARGGAYYFRIGKDVAAQFWHEICLLAVGDILQGAVETKRECKFNVTLTRQHFYKIFRANIE